MNTKPRESGVFYNRRKIVEFNEVDLFIIDKIVKIMLDRSAAKTLKGAKNYFDKKIAGYLKELRRKHGVKINGMQSFAKVEQKILTDYIESVTQETPEIPPEYTRYTTAGGRRLNTEYLIVDDKKKLYKNFSVNDLEKIAGLSPQDYYFIGEILYEEEGSWMQKISIVKNDLDENVYHTLQSYVKDGGEWVKSGGVLVTCYLIVRHRTEKFGAKMQKIPHTLKRQSQKK